MPELTAPKRMSNGQYIDLNDFTVDNVDLVNANRSLNHIYRFTGHYKDKPPLTVAQHTKLCIELANEVFPGEKDVAHDCLLHDMAESVTGDISTNMKKMLGAGFKDFEHHIEQVFYDKLWKISIPFSEECYHKRKICDLMSLDIERRSMWIDQTGKENWPETPASKLSLSLKEKQIWFDRIQAEGEFDLEAEYNRQLLVGV